MSEKIKPVEALLQSVVVAYLLAFVTSKIISKFTGLFYAKGQMSPIGLLYFTLFGVDLTETAIRQLLFLVMFVYLYWRVSRSKTALKEWSEIETHLIPIWNAFKKLFSWTSFGTMFVAIGIMEILYWNEISINPFILIKDFAVQTITIAIIVHVALGILRKEYQVDKSLLIIAGLLTYFIPSLFTKVFDGINGFINGFVLKIFDRLFSISDLSPTILTFETSENLFKTGGHLYIVLGILFFIGIYLAASEIIKRITKNPHPFIRRVLAVIISFIITRTLVSVEPIISAFGIFVFETFGIYLKLAIGIAIVVFNKKLSGISTPVLKFFIKTYNWIPNFIPILPKIPDIKEEHTALDIFNKYEDETRYSNDIITKVALIIELKKRKDDYRAILEQLALVIATHVDKRRKEEFIEKLKDRYGENSDLVDSLDRLVDDVIKEEKKRKSFF